ncbi:MAG: hypothetical protein WDN06_13890 [Asticcacaulis sp.]
MKKFSVTAGVLVLMATMSGGAAIAKVKVKPAMPVPVPVIQPIEPSVVDQAATLRDAALQSNAAYQWVSDLTTRFGARPAGSDKERRRRPGRRTN